MIKDLNGDNCFEDLEATRDRGGDKLRKEHLCDGYDDGGQHVLMDDGDIEVKEQLNVMIVAPSVDNVGKLQSNELREDDICDGEVGHSVREDEQHDDDGDERDKGCGDDQAVYRNTVDNIFTDSVMSVTIWEGGGTGTLVDHPDTDSEMAALDSTGSRDNHETREGEKGQDAVHSDAQPVQPVQGDVGDDSSDGGGCIFKRSLCTTHNTKGRKITTKTRKWTKKKFGFGWVTTNKISYECTSRMVMVTPSENLIDQENSLSLSPGSGKGIKGTTTTQCVQHFCGQGLSERTEDEFERELDTQDGQLGTRHHTG